jgi:hypothetical protein
MAGRKGRVTNNIQENFKANIMMLWKIIFFYSSVNMQAQILTHLHKIILYIVVINNHNIKNTIRCDKKYNFS